MCFSAVYDIEIPARKMKIDHHQNLKTHAYIN